jgi:putative aminopeptidase FrvX
MGGKVKSERGKGLPFSPRADIMKTEDRREKERIAMDLSAYEGRVLRLAQQLLRTDSPSGFTHRVVELAEGLANGLGYETRRSKKGGLTVLIPGREQGKQVGLCAHVDTLGLMVRSVGEGGELRITKIGGPMLPTLDGEYCTIYTRDGRSYSGTILSCSPAAHVFEDALTRPRDEKNMYVRLDERVANREEVFQLGIQTGDYVCIDPKTVVTGSGFLKSRFIDDKGSAACLLALLEWMREEDCRPRYDTQIIFTVHEEVGHGGATLPRELDELVAVDMGCVGEDLTCTEYQVSICAKDSAGPYDYQLVSRLMTLAREGGVDYAVDVYPYYTSDVTVAWRAGEDVKAALVGPGVHASHGMERTHAQALLNTIQLLALYLECQ